MAKAAHPFKLQIARIKVYLAKRRKKKADKAVKEALTRENKDTKRTADISKSLRRNISASDLAKLRRKRY